MNGRSMVHDRTDRTTGEDRAPHEGRAQDGQERPSSPQAFEWVVGGLSGLLVVAMIGFILYDAISGSTRRPDITVEAGQVVAAGGGFRVDFRALNRGDVTAAHVEIEGHLKRGGQTVETSVTEFDYLPPHSGRSGGLFFRNDPRQYHLQLGAKGYSEP